MSWDFLGIFVFLPHRSFCLGMFSGFFFEYALEGAAMMGWSFFPLSFEKFFVADMLQG